MTIAYNGGKEIGGGGGTHHVVGPVPEGGRLVLVCRVQGGESVELTGHSNNLCRTPCNNYS